MFGRFERTMSLGRWFGSQLAVSILATACVSALFAQWQKPVAPPIVPIVADTGKSLRRVADGEVATTVVRYDAQQQAALASLNSFIPTAAPVIVAPAAIRVSAPVRIVTVLPPPRPVMSLAAAAPAPSVQAAKPEQGWHVAGLEIPGSARVRNLVPSGDDLLRNGGAAWTASANAVRKVATLGSLLGL